MPGHYRKSLKERKLIFKKTPVTWIILGILILLVVSVCFFVFTTKGSVFIVKYALARYSGARKIVIASASGSLSERLLLKDIEASDIKWLPAGSSLKIQKMDLYFLQY